MHKICALKNQNIITNANGWVTREKRRGYLLSDFIGYFFLIFSYTSPIFMSGTTFSLTTYYNLFVLL